MSDVESTPRAPKRQRASRKGQPRRFVCSQSGCEKRYSRAEHLARHELNHTPREIYRCDRCDHTFVRLDLYKRHSKKHDEGTTFPPAGTNGDSAMGNSSNQGSDESPGPRASITSNNFDLPPSLHVRNPSHPTGSFSSVQASGFPQSLATPSSMVSNFGAPGRNSITQNGDSLDNTYASLPASNWPTTYTGLDNGIMDSNQANDGFAAWLFDSPGSQDPEFDLNNLPFLDYGMDYYTPTDLWNFDNSPLMVNSQAQYNYTAPDAIADLRTVFPEEGHLHISQEKRDQIAAKLKIFREKKRKDTTFDAYTREDSLFHESGDQSWPNVTTAVLRNCLSAYWKEVARQMPILHQPTFSCEECNPLLLLAMIALGASQLVRINPQGVLHDYKDFADLIATNIRWEILETAEPPVALWTAQSLLLLELYEKMYSSRRLHERAHIHHASTLTLLRRGSPLVGSGDDTPQSCLPTRASTPVPGKAPPAVVSESMRWWRRWAQTESMHRVVFSAFQMDTLHAVLFGHESGLLPYEIRLPLPCDESLWTATSPEEVHRLEATFSMHGIKSINFLDGLKRCLHGQEVQSHPNARLILAAGLLSVSWHINRREKHLQFIESVPTPREQERWRSLLLNAFGHWRQSFEDALGTNRARRTSTALPGEISDPTVLFHLAYITMHSDIIDSQILAGSKRLLGRKVSDRDLTNVIQRAKTWADTSVARLAVLHAFKLLHETLVRPSVALATSAAPTKTGAYACRADPSIYRPWALHLAGLTVWAYQYALRLKSGSENVVTQMPALGAPNGHAVACQYISKCAVLEDPDRLLPLMNAEGCAATLQMLSEDFAFAESEILMESAQRLENCIRLLTGNA